MKQNINKSYKEKIYLMPGKLIIADTPMHVWTVLGSCIAIIFHSKRLNAAAICHAKLPASPINNKMCSFKCLVHCNVKSAECNFDYVTCSLKYMYENFIKLGALKSEIEISLFGGSTVTSSGYRRNSIGYKNIQIAEELLRKKGLRISNKQVGGEKGRTINFYTDTGEIEIKVH